MTKILLCKITLGFSVFVLLFFIVFANVMINKQKNNNQFATYFPASTTQSLKTSVENVPFQKKTQLSSRVNTFQYLSYILDDKEEKLKEKLMKRYSLNTKKAEQYTKVISKVSEKYNIPSDLLAALIRTESNYYSKAVSHKNAIGPTQIIAKYWKNDCAENLFDIGNNVQCAAIILNRYKERCRNNWDCTLKMYNIGPGNYYKNNKFYQQAGIRYLTKINKNLKLLNG
ncbi:MAG: transglycosylase SLT domain-containing protein [Gammaproteobacteria bacterium]|nr:transglycosylase SLT domain-containing protein [Gammaproteobacteria bacterium]